MTVSESLLQISDLTKQNLQILQMINDSFYTKSNHLSAMVGDTTYTIPSYIALENKVNHIQDAFNNLVHAAKAGEAWFNFDGNSKEVLVRGYQQAPNPVDLKPTNFFGAEQSFLFKDMLTPQPYLNFDMSSIPDDINSVIVKKFIPYNKELITKLTLQGSQSVEVDGNAMAELTWKQVQLCLNSGTVDFIEGTDYAQYDTIYKLPLRQPLRTGSYVIEEVVEDKINDDLENVITLKIHSATPLTATGQDGIMESDLRAGDYLVTYDGSAKLKILNIHPATRVIDVLVCSGEYVNAVGSGPLQLSKEELMDYVSDYSKLRLYSTINKERPLHIPLEEDKYVFIAVAPVNERLNIRTEWGKGIFVNTNQLRKDNPDGDEFRSYYNQNVQNIGDAIVEFSNIMFPSVTKYTPLQMEAMSAAPEFDTKTIQVVQINKHLNDSEAVKNIRTLYSQKKQYQTDLNEIQTRIRALSDELITISFDDMSGIRSAITAQITDLKTQQNNLITSVNKITDAIANSANNAEIPIEDGKFRIRGYVDVDAFANRVLTSFNPSDSDKVDVANSIRNNILGVQCRYRYKNPDIPQANVAVIDNFLFSDWSTYNPPLRERTMQYENGKYQITYKDINKNDRGEISFNKSANEIKFNQLDVPISQGEMVEMQVRIVWGFGYPFATVTSAWSEPVDVSFPPELVKDVQVTTIIKENNSDIETNRFSNILREEGVTQHIGDKVEDQDVTFFHRPESISSGFYTSERRVVPLKDKLLELSNNITAIMDDLKGTHSDALRISFLCDNVEYELLPDIQNVVQLPAYNAVAKLADNIPTGAAYNKNGVVYVTGQIKILNTTQHTVRLFPVIPGARDKFIQHKLKDKRIENIAYDDKYAKIWRTNVYSESGTCIIFPQGEGDDISTFQRGNQLALFCRANPFNGAKYRNLVEQYPGVPSDEAQQKRSYAGTRDPEDPSHRKDADTFNGLIYYPVAVSQYALCLESDSISAKKELAPGESFVLPIFIEYKLSAEEDGKSEATQTCGISLRNSLYQDPLYYEFLLVAKYNQSTSDQLVAAKNLRSIGTKYNIVVR